MEEEWEEINFDIESKKSPKNCSCLIYYMYLINQTNGFINDLEDHCYSFSDNITDKVVNLPDRIIELVEYVIEI